MSAERFGAVVEELQGLLQRLDSASPKARALVYAECIPLLVEVHALNRPPFPTKEVKALIHEAGWHLRSLAGLAMVRGGRAEDHVRWAEQSLEALAVWAERES